MTAPRRVGFVGLGAMGGGMAAHLVRSGFAVRAFDLRPEAVEALAAAGAEPAASPADAAGGADVVVTSLPDPAAVEAAVLGEAGIVAGIRAGAVLVEMSTSEPETTRRLGAELERVGAGVVDAPVGKGPDAAARGELTLMVGGAPETIEACADVLDALGSRRHHCGPPGSGHAMKLANNVVSCAVNALVGEGMALGAKAGLDPDTMLEVMSSTAADNWHLRNTFPVRVFRGRFEPNFRLALAHKDLGLALAFAAAEGVPLPVAEGAYALHQLALDLGLGDEDQSATIKVLERRTGVPVRSRASG